MYWIHLFVSAGIMLVLVGCSSKAGPFMTNISSDGHGGLVIEKCMAQFDLWVSAVIKSECTNTNI